MSFIRIDYTKYLQEEFVVEALSKLAHCEVLYVSFDVNSMDCDMISYGTGILVPKGLMTCSFTVKK